MKQVDTYEFDRELKSEKAVVRVYRPILSDEERQRRMRAIHRAAETLLKGAIFHEN